MRGQRLKRADAETVDVPGGEVIDVSAFNPAGFRPRADRREIACPQDRNGAKRSGNWRELIKKVWEADPLLCPHCEHEPERSGDSLSKGQPRRGGPLGQQMRIIAFIDEAAVIERILRHLGLWEAGVRVDAGRASHPEIPGD